MNRFTGFLFKQKNIIHERKYPSPKPNDELPTEIMRNPNYGLHAGKQIMKGHYVTRTNRRMPRIWRPNIVMGYYHSDILNYTFHIPVSTHAIRLIDKAGSLDAYILYTSAKNLGSPFGINFQTKLKYVIEHHPEIPIPPFLEVRYKNNQNKGKFITNNNNDIDISNTNVVTDTNSTNSDIAISNANVVTN